MKKQLKVSACLLLCLLASLALAGSFSLIRVPAPGVYEARVDGVGMVSQIEVYDSAVASGTVLLYTMVPGATTSNLQYTVTCSGGKALVVLTNSTFYVAGGDTLIRTGTATNGLVRLILE